MKYFSVDITVVSFKKVKRNGYCSSQRTSVRCGIKSERVFNRVIGNKSIKQRLEVDSLGAGVASVGADIATDDDADALAGVSNTAKDAQYPAVLSSTV